VYEFVMSEPTETYSGGLDFSGAASAAEARRFQEILERSRPLPEGVRRVGFRYGEDHSGSPAVWIVITAHDDLKPSQEKITALRRYSNKLRDEFQGSGTDRWPYVTIETES